ncbi:hypothetical protein N7468_008702 [Penicillium chermesinum]|uniref:Polyketide synthase n=1 Tax=Penicillium chermesinum TaxID=63820 RepID=A0A9W9TEA8_9EURO|nr:uncharacterized protein N7468_008702 [Penicillium chermesinum]KAJ5219498.1 hypothetical protein N7468_008702 [Penicillium chermesinum]
MTPVLRAAPAIVEMGDPSTAVFRLPLLAWPANSEETLPVPRNCGTCAWRVKTAGGAIPQERFDLKSLYHPDQQRFDRHHVRGGFFLQDDLKRFDAAFFNLSAESASAMDPQLRLLMESAYEAIENAGIPMESFSGSNASVFTGTFARDYFDTLIRDPENLPASFITGNGGAMLSNRISHFYNLTGPSMTIDTGCSSSAVAIHQGCRNLQAGESDLSLVGASSVLLNPDMFIAMSNLNVLNAEGRCYSWDHRSNGYGRGEGVATLLLKRLDDALRDGDHVHAVIRETALNQDGKTTTISSPSMEAQQQLIEECYRRAGLDLAQTAYVEAHMTGTATGDPIEAEAIARTFGQHRSSDDPVLVGSVKTNLGHTEPIPLDEWHLQVPTLPTQWPQDKSPRASINNFGYGGTNAHIIMERAPTPARQINRAVEQDESLSRVFLLSSRDEAVTKAMSSQLASYVRESASSTEKSVNSFLLADLAHTLAERRSRFPWSIAVKARSVNELATRLEDPSYQATRAIRNPRVGFVFNGQGAQWHAMGRELISTYPVFASAIEQADEILRDYGTSWSLNEELLRDEAATRVHETAFSQPISVALQLCLVDLLKSWGITPSAVTSHSSGEIAAAYAVGVLSFQEALGVVYHRGRLAQKYQELSSLAGEMLAAGLSADKAEAYLQTTTSGRVVVACINSPDSVTLSGDLPALEEVASRLEQDNFFARKLKVPLAYHSHHMLLMAQEYTESLWYILPTTRSWTGAVFSSPVTGGIITSPDILDPEHWTRNLTSPVLFAEALENMCFDGTSQSAPTPQVDILVEIGAHSTLSGPIRQTLQQRMIPYVSCLKRGVNAVDTMQDTARELVVRGYAVSLAAVNSSNSGQETGQCLHDLPSYPWNHTAEYWSEPRIYREHRYKRFPPHELLGTPVSGVNQLTPTWRNFLRIAHVPWLADHRVDSKVVLPGASYVTMAIEAIRQLTDSSESSISGYRLRDIDITNTLTIPETSTGVETQLCLRPCSDQELDHKGWYEFELCSVGQDDTWIQNCKGYVAVETVHPNQRTERQTVSASSYWPAGEKAAPVDPESIFVSLRKMNFHHGPTFQNLLASQAAGSRSITTMALSTAVPGIDEQNYVIHPTTLDSIVQSFYVDVPAEMKERAQVVPRSIGSMFVARDLKRRAGDTLHVFTELIQANQRGTRSKAIVAHGLDESTGYLEINGFHFQAIPQGHGDDAGPEDKRLCSRMSWELDVLHNFPASLRDSLKIYLSEAEVDFEKRIRRASYYLISDAVAELEGQSRDGWQWHHKIFYNWMKEIVAQGKAGTLACGSASWSRATKGIKQRLYDQLSAEQAAGRLTCHVGLQLASIVRGEVTPLELMMEGNLLNEYYEVLPKLKHRTYRQLKQVAELYAVKNPGANVLEIGAGTGGATTVILDAFGARSGAESGTLLGHYDFTDISSGFFRGREAESFDTGKYDLIVASAVLHATKSLHRTMSHVCRLLKPGGTVLMIENTTDTLDMQLIFGTLPGWWLSEESDRKMSPNVPLETWDSVFRATGFSGVDFEIADCEEPDFSSESIIISTAKSQPAYPPSMSIIYSQAAPPQEWLNELAENMQTQCGYCPSVQSLETVEPQENCVYITLLDMERPILNDIDSITLEQVKKLLSNSLGLLWLSSGSVIDAKKPLFALAQGMLRTLKQEDTDKRCIQLDFESTGCPWTADKIPHIMHVLHQSFDYRRIPTEIEWEYAPGRGLMWEPSRSGLLNEIYFTDAPALEGVIPRGMVEIEPKAFGLNFRDVMVALGQLDETLVGHECAGIVRGLGSGSHESGLKVGDRVCGIGEDRFGSTTRAAWTSVVRIPDEMAWEEAASIPYAFITAYIGLFDIARLQKGQRVLIQAATGGVGQAALILAQWAGAEVFATCGTAAKRELLINHYHLAPDHIFSSRNPSFAAGVMAQTNGDGVDVILNSLAGPLLKASWECIARFGRFVEIGKVDLEMSRRVDLSPLARSATLAGLDLLQYLRYQPQMVHHALQACVQLCHAQQSVRAVHPITLYSMADMDQAMRSMQGGSHTGKLVLVPGAEDQVRVVTRPRPLRLDRSESTYLVVGGLGGVGRAIALWMIEQGARHVLVVSRNAASHPDAAQLIDNASAHGCNLYIRDCDVADEAGFLKLLDDCAETMPPIRGVVQAAMVLDDTVLERITHEQWQRAILPKVAGTMNLHRHLPSLDFFIMLSSMTGITGHVSQANYAAGNTFQDALARHRTAHGQPAVVLDLGPVSSVGFVAEAEDDVRARVARTLGSTVLPLSRMLRLIGEAIRHPLRGHPDDSQIVTCIAQYDDLSDDMAAKRDRRFGTLQVGTAAVGSAGIKTTPAGMDRLDELVYELAHQAGGGDESRSGELVQSALVRKIGAMFRVTDAEVEVDVPLSQQGVDSLVAVELRNWLSSVMKARVTIFEILQSGSVADFARIVTARSGLIMA